MAWKSGRKGDKEKRESQLGTPALSEASYDEKHDAKDKHDGKAVVPKQPEAKQVIPPVSFRALFRYV